MLLSDNCNILRSDGQAGDQDPEFPQAICFKPAGHKSGLQ